MLHRINAEYYYFPGWSHCMSGNPGKRSSSYLSPTNYEQMILLMGKRMKAKIDEKVICSKYVFIKHSTRYFLP